MLKTPFHNPKFLEKELDYKKGRLRSITQKYCVGIRSLDGWEEEDMSPFVKMAFDIITNEVWKYQAELRGIKLTPTQSIPRN